MSISEQIARRILSIPDAVKFNFENPFTWFSGYKMPMYVDARKLLGNYEDRNLVVEGLSKLIKFDDYEIIAGIASGGVPWAYDLANRFRKGFVYMGKPKNHGLEGEISGLPAEEIKGKNILLVDDTLSLGTSLTNAVKVLKNAGAKCNAGISVYSYEFNEALTSLRREAPNLSSFSSLYYETLIDIAAKEGRLNQRQLDALVEWRKDPLNWREKHGFPRAQ